MNRAGRYFLALPFAISMATTTSATASDQKWSPWFEAGGYISTERDRGEATAFLPLFQSNDRLLFTDVKGKLFSEGVKEGNFALGYRQMTGWGVNLGIWGGYDIRESVTGNSYEQLAFGVEALSADYDFRFNGFTPIGDSSVPAAGAGIQIVGSQIFLTGGKEVALGGFEGEVGYRLPLETLFSANEKHEFRVYAGGYRFDDSEIAKAVQGPRFRAEWRVNDVIPGLPGSSLAIESRFQHDSYRDDQWEAGLRLRIPLFGSDKPKSLSRTERRMAEAIIRDTDIVTTSSSSRENVKDMTTGVALDQVVHVSASDDLAQTVDNTGANSLILVDGSNGPIATGRVRLTDSQTLAGGGATLQLQGVSSGTVVNYTVPGATPTLLSNCSNCTMIVINGSNINVAGLSLDGNQKDANVAIAAVVQNNNIHLNDLEATQFAKTAFHFDMHIESQMNNVKISDVGEYGVYFRDQNKVTINNLEVTNSGMAGLGLISSNEITLNNATIENIETVGIHLDSDNLLSMENVVIRDIIDLAVGGSGGIMAENNNTLNMTNVLVSDIGEFGLGIFGSDGNTFNATNLTVRNTGLGGAAIELYDNNTLNLTDSLIENTVAWAIYAGENNDISLDKIVVRNAGQEPFPGFVLDAFGLLEDNNFSLSNSTIEGTTAGHILLVAESNNTLSGDGNTLTATYGGQLCSAAPGYISGSISFDDGSVIADGNC